ncbi:MAG TPA: hypothetical protein DCP98_07675 [Sphaerochaeta sp.]|nr:hypothetical protein [Sphaerochaeta sp.]
MKKVLAILAILVVFSFIAFADDSATLNITLTIEAVPPTLTLMGSTDNSTFSHADVAFGSLAANASTITAYFRVDYTAYRWNKSITVSAAAGSLTSTTVADTADPDSTTPTVTNATKDFSGAAGAAGSFATFSVTWNVANLSAASYSAPVTVTYTVE